MCRPDVGDVIVFYWHPTSAGRGSTAGPSMAKQCDDLGTVATDPDMLWGPESLGALAGCFAIFWGAEIGQITLS